ncbi:DUF397 domain-containing protein [Streptomyces sp. AC512_CC834]|uniref:DUF397 domain-containing protein n=1 Tax=Streptomyces sp. AC512_CC834 TaxID=2823691 RepID=UPI001C27AF9D|nr:DUF397 domain-containing protein [Streptomyces sp. AC512_CC834]
MNETQPAPFPVTAGWFKSSYSAANNECIEVAHTVAQVGIRDSKVSGRRGFTVSADAFALFVVGLKDRGCGVGSPLVSRARQLPSR